MRPEGMNVPANPFARQFDYARWREDEPVEWIDWIWDKLDQLSTTWKKYQVDWEPVTKGEWTLQRAVIPKRSYERLHHVCDGPKPSLDRDCGWGPITALKHNGRVWMSDTRAEIMEHAPLLNKLWLLELFEETSVLINGLGLGMAVNAALLHGAKHVDVVEIDQDVIDIIGPNFADKPVTIHHADALKKTWPKGSSWTLVWHDIWPTIDEGNLPAMERLHRMYGGRSQWQGSWQHERCLALRKHYQELQTAVRSGDWVRAKQLDPEF